VRIAAQVLQELAHAGAGVNHGGAVRGRAVRAASRRRVGDDSAAGRAAG
jgi:hypothetical protein